MAITLPSKAPEAAIRYSWIPPVAKGDGLSTATVTRTSGTATLQSYEIDGDAVAIVLSDGTTGTTTIFAAEVVTSEGEVLTETLYLPVVASTVSIGDTARSICLFALRKVVGAGMTPTAVELDDALERLNLMLTGWKYEGADVGAAFPLDANSVIYCPDYMVEGIKYNLILQIAPRYAYDLSELELLHARRGLQRIKQTLLPDDRGSVAYS